MCRNVTLTDCYDLQLPWLLKSDSCTHFNDDLAFVVVVNRSTQHLLINSEYLVSFIYIRSQPR